jgi:hypothetical protein
VDGSIVIPDAAQDPAAYVASLLETLGGQDPIMVYAATPSRVQQFVQDLDDRRWLTRMADGEWNAYQIVGHLIDVDIVYGFRWRLALTADAPTYPGYDERGWANLPKARPRVLLSGFLGLRESNRGLIEGIPHDQWARPGVHGEQGPEDVGLMIRKIAGHDLAHLDQLERTVRKAMA